MLNHKVIQSGDGDSKRGSPVKEYYEVFGLQEGASLEDVTARYMMLKRSIISAIEQGRKPQKTIQEINEAYVKLKEAKIPTAVNFDLEEHLRKSITSVRAERRKARKRKIILASSVLAVFLIVGISVLMLQKPKEALPPGSTSPEDPNLKTKASLEKAGPFSALEPKTPEKMGQVSKVVPKEPGKPPLPEKAKPAAAIPSPQEPPAASVPPAKPAPSVEVALAVPQEPSKPPINERAKPVAEGVAGVEIARQAPPAPAPETPLKAPQEMKAKVETPVVPLVPPPPKPAPPVEAAKAAPQEASKSAKPQSAKAPEPVREKEQKVASVSPSAIASDLEVRNFFDNYLGKYNRKEINGFIALFSAKAIQNQKDDVEKIRKTYENFFGQMESVNYQIAITGIEPKQDRLEVKAQYVLEGIVSKGRRAQTWKGQIQWVLVREEGALRVLSLNYQPQSSK